MNFESIEVFFSRPRYIYLAPEQAVCYMLYRLLESDCYATQLITELISDHPHLRLSDTNLYAAITFLTSVGSIRSYEKKCTGRGRPRKMFALEAKFRADAQQISCHWGKVTGGAR